MDVSDKSRDAVYDCRFEAINVGNTFPICKVEPETVGGIKPEEDATAGATSEQEGKAVEIETLLYPTVKVEIEDVDPLKAQEYCKEEVKIEENVLLHGYNKEPKNCENDDYILPDDISMTKTEEPVFDMGCGIDMVYPSSEDSVNESLNPGARGQHCTEAEDMKHTNIQEVKKPIECNIYSKSLHSPSKCDVCGKRFTHVEHLKRHQLLHTVEKSSTRKAIHTGQKSFKCDFCEKSFTRKGHLACHTRIHTGQRPFKCTLCEKSYTTESHLSYHTRIHTGQRPFKCALCEESFTTKSHLSYHTRIHTGKRPFKCAWCEKSFTTKSHLSSHTRIHTGQRPFECTLCEKSFTTKSHLFYHTRIHTGQRPFKCTLCEKSYTTKSHLSYHTRVHTGQKPFKCALCEKTFTRKSHLSYHTRVHMGQKSFKCPSCEENFTQKGDLTTHTYVHDAEAFQMRMV